MGKIVWSGALLQESSMRTCFKDPRQLRLLIGVSAGVLLAICGISAVMAWMPGSADMAEPVPALDNIRPPPASLIGTATQDSAESAAGDARPRAKCAECGIVESTREVEPVADASGPPATGEVPRAANNAAPATRSRSYEVIVRMQDGSNRRFVHTPPAKWRAGERLILIAGTSPANN